MAPTTYRFAFPEIGYEYTRLDLALRKAFAEFRLVAITFLASGAGNLDQRFKPRKHILAIAVADWLHRYFPAEI